MTHAVETSPSRQFSSVYVCSPFEPSNGRARVCLQVQPLACVRCPEPLVAILRAEQLDALQAPSECALDDSVQEYLAGGESTVRLVIAGFHGEVNAGLLKPKFHGNCAISHA